MRMLVVATVLLAGLATAPARGRELIAQESDFTCLLDWPKVHDAPAKPFEFVCERTHGCIQLNLSDQLIDSLQVGDPRCQPAH